MIAIAKIGGHQYIVREGDSLEVDRLSAEVGKKVDFPVMLVSDEDGGNFQLGNPTLANATVSAKIVEHVRGDKIRVFKMKPRKRYRRTLGHRQDFTAIEISAIEISAKKPEKTVEKNNPKK